MPKSTKKQQLIAEAISLGLPAKPSWTVKELEIRIKKAKRYNPPKKNPNNLPEITETGEVVNGHHRLSVEGEKGSDPTLTTDQCLDQKDSAPTVVPSTHRETAQPPKTNSLLGSRIGTVPIDNAPHLIVEARAGTGKTTTLIEGLKRIKGIESRLTPSPQQAAVWDCMELSKGKVNTICFVAFNKAIAVELQGRVPPGCDAMTMHSMGYKAVQKALGRFEPNSYVVSDIISELLERDIRDLRREKATVLNATESLVSLCKMNLVDPNRDKLSELASYYDIDLDGNEREVFDLVPQVLNRCKEPKGKIDFDDMIWLPIVLNLPVFQYDLLLVDEAQDLNRCQQALAKKSGKRLILCGDPRQAIYGFAGADAESMPRMARELAIDSHPQKFDARGCLQLPLTVTRRCGKAIVEEAKKIVPDFEAFETNCEGTISTARYPTQKQDDRTTELPWEQTYMAQAKDGDMVLCRVNAPLVSNCFLFIKKGIRANIQGRDIGKGLINTVKKMKAQTVVDLVGKLDDWLANEQTKENAKRNPNDNKLIAMQDRYDCLLCFTDGVTTIDGVIAKIESVFTDDKQSPGIKLSSIHKAKGLEANRVFFLMPKGAECPHPMAKTRWQYEQEMNLKYVAITRAIEELTYVS